MLILHCQSLRLKDFLYCLFPWSFCFFTLYLNGIDLCDINNLVLKMISWFFYLFKRFCIRLNFFLSMETFNPRHFLFFSINLELEIIWGNLELSSSKKLSSLVFHKSFDLKNYLPLHFFQDFLQGFFMSNSFKIICKNKIYENQYTWHWNTICQKLPRQEVLTYFRDHMLQHIFKNKN